MEALHSSKLGKKIRKKTNRNHYNIRQATTVEESLLLRVPPEDDWRMKTLWIKHLIETVKVKDTQSLFGMLYLKYEHLLRDVI